MPSTPHSSRKVDPLVVFALVMTPVLWPALLFEYFRYKPFHRRKK